MTAAEVLALIDLASRAMALANSAIVRARERGEWTPEQEAEFQARRDQVTSRPHWQKS